MMNLLAALSGNDLAEDAAIFHRRGTVLPPKSCLRYILLVCIDTFKNRACIRGRYWRRPALPAGATAREARLNEEGAHGGNPVSPMLNAAGADVGGVVPAGEWRDLDDIAGVRSVDELSAADVDADVAEAVEEDE